MKDYYLPYTRTIEGVLSIRADTVGKALEKAEEVLDAESEHDERLVMELDTEWEFSQEVEEYEIGPKPC